MAQSRSGRPATGSCSTIRRTGDEYHLNSQLSMPNYPEDKQAAQMAQGIYQQMTQLINLLSDFQPTGGQRDTRIVPTQPMQ